MTAPGTLYIIAAPSGAGKTSLVNRLLETVPGVEKSVSHTTRPPRPGERDSVDYHFVDPDTFQSLARQGAFLEHARVFGDDYGTSRQAVLERLGAGVDLFLVIDWQGARQVRARIQAPSIFILPPSLEVLRRRLRQRGQDDPAVIERRMQAAVGELSHYREFDYLVVNDDFNAALTALQAIVLAQRQRRETALLRHAELIHGLLS